MSIIRPKRSSFLDKSLVCTMNVSVITVDILDWQVISFERFARNAFGVFESESVYNTSMPDSLGTLIEFNRFSRENFVGRHYLCMTSIRGQCR